MNKTSHIWDILDKELDRQEHTIELIASENYPSDNRQRDHRRDKHQFSCIVLAFLEIYEERNAGQNGNAEINPHILPVPEQPDPSEDNSRNNKAENEIRKPLFHRLCPSQNATTCSQVTAFRQS